MSAHADPTIAVCVPSIPPRRDVLARCVAGIRAQTRPANQVIVVTDTDGEGAGATRNRAWRQASTEWVAFVDDDDELLPDHLERCAEPFTEGADVVYPWFHLGGIPGREDPLAVPSAGRLVTPLGVSFGDTQAAYLRTANFIPSAIVVRRTLLEDVGGYPLHDTDEYRRYAGCEDWALLVRLLDAGAHFAHVPHRTWILHDDAVSTAGRPWR